MTDLAPTFKSLAAADLHVMIIDYSTASRTTQREMLVGLGVNENNISEARAPTAALSFLLSKGQKPHVIVLHTNMPDDNSLTLLRAIKANATLAPIPVIIASARGDRAEICAAAGDKLSSYLNKPFTPSIFHEKLKLALAKVGAQLV